LLFFEVTMKNLTLALLILVCTCSISFADSPQGLTVNADGTISPITVKGELTVTANATIGGDTTIAGTVTANALILPPMVYAEYRQYISGYVTAAGKKEDTHSLIDGTNNWIVPKSGIYSITYLVTTHATNNISYGNIYKNGAILLSGQGARQGYDANSFSLCGAFRFNAGDKIMFAGSGSGAPVEVTATIAKIGD